MIRGMHGLLYSSDPESTRRFFREVVRLPGSDIGEGWWIFDFAEGDLGVHPVDDPADAGTHDVSFYCDDIHGTVRELRSRGVEFTSEVEDHGYGLVTYFTVPGGIKIQLYEPRYSKRPTRARATRGKPAGRARTGARGSAPPRHSRSRRARGKQS